MAEAVSALNGATARVGGIAVRDAGPQGMITLRGDLSEQAFHDAVCDLTGAAFPEPNRAEVADGKGLCWMSPDELLVLVPHAEAGAAVARIAAALAGTHHLIADVSDARALITLEGAGAREVLAKLGPVDLHPDAFGPGAFRRSRLGQVAAAYWMAGEDRFQVICFRSVADYAFKLLVTSAAAGPVGHF